MTLEKLQLIIYNRTSLAQAMIGSGVQASLIQMERNGTFDYAKYFYVEVRIMVEVQTNPSSYNVKLDQCLDMYNIK